MMVLRGSWRVANVVQVVGNGLSNEGNPGSFFRFCRLEVQFCADGCSSFKSTTKGVRC